MDSINGQIGEEGQAPLLVIAEESETAVPALTISEESEAPAPPPVPVAKVAKAAARSQEVPVAIPSVPLPQPPQHAAPEAQPIAKPRHTIRRLIPLAAVSLAVFASSVSVIGLLVASRTVAETRTVLEQVQAHQNKIRHLDAMIDQIDGLRRREQVALTRIEQINAGRPATGMEVRGAIASLQLALSKYQPGGANGTLTLLRDGQSELAERVSTMYRRVERIDDQLQKMAVSSNPQAKRGADRGPIS